MSQQETDSPDLPECFGNLEKVFPMTDCGLRQTPEDCFYHCPVKTRCLRLALAEDGGAQMEEEIIERRTSAGMMNFFERWSVKSRYTGA